MKTSSLNDSRHFFIIVNDYKRMSCLYFLKEKLVAFQKFVEFKPLVENNMDVLSKLFVLIKGENFFQIILIHFANIKELEDK